MEGFLSLEQAAEQLQYSVSELSRQIEEGRVVAIVKEGRSWLSAGEVSRLKRLSERASQPPAEPEGELRLLRRSTAETIRPPVLAPAERPLLSFSPLETPKGDSNESSEVPARPLLSIGPLGEAAPLEPLSRPEDADPALVLEVPTRPEASHFVSDPVSPDRPRPAVLSTPLEVKPVTPVKAEPEGAPEVVVKEPEIVKAREPAVAPAPSKAAEPVKPSEPVRPAEAMKPVEPVRPAKASEPVKAAPHDSERLEGSGPSRPGASSGPDEKSAQQIRELNKRCAELENRNLELEAMANRLKAGLQETEATLKRNRSARTNLENDVIGLQDQLSKARARNEALEREIQHLGSELERIEDSHNSELRRLRSKADRSGDERDTTPAASPVNTAELEALRNQMAEKDRLLAQEYEQRATLRSQLEDKQQKYFELKARYDKEKSEWSELLAQALQNQGHLRAQLEEMKARNPKGWNPFRREK